MLVALIIMSRLCSFSAVESFTCAHIQSTNTSVFMSLTQKTTQYNYTNDFETISRVLVVVVAVDVVAIRTSIYAIYC